MTIKITPLQYLLANKIVPIADILQATSTDRSTVWRWALGKHQPRKDTAEQLISLFSTHSVEIAEINKNNYILDFNGCYSQLLEVSDDFFNDLH